MRNPPAKDISHPKYRSNLGGEDISLFKEMCNSTAKDIFPPKEMYYSPTKYISPPKEMCNLRGLVSFADRFRVLDLAPTVLVEGTAFI